MSISPLHLSQSLVLAPLFWLLPQATLAATAESRCVDLQHELLNNGSVTRAELVPAGSFDPAGNYSAQASGLYADLGEFCRVSATLTPSLDSDIKVEVWLPVIAWNGRYMGVGNGAFTGSVRHSAMAAPLARGYAVSSTDTGHSGNTASFGLGHPEKVADFGWRAVHEMSVVSKKLVAAFYEQAPAWSYWSGCSAGGRQAMVEAQKFPGDFDGIIAGAPGLDWTGRAAAALRVATHLEANPVARLSAGERELVYSAAVNACDADDGVRDGLISWPESCSFDAASLACDGANTGSCLNPDQVDTVKMLYSSVPNPETGRDITGLFPGSELGWTDLGWTASARATGLEQYRYLVYGDEDWNISEFEFDRDIALAESMDGNTLNALDPDLQAFFDTGGKLIQYHGWIDPQISPANATQYYQRVSDLLGGREAIHDSYRLFMVPGMAHCRGGPGPDSFDMIGALEQWVESGQAPDSVMAVRRTNGEVDRSRPLCPYPEVAVYDGSGSIDAAENFQCRLP